MPITYTRRHGFDWPIEMSPEFIDLTVAKKWRMYRDEQGVIFPDPHVRLLDAAKALLPKGAFVVSPWSEEHAYDFVHESKGVVWGSAASSKSNDLGLFTVMYWITDPYETVCLVGSTTLKALQSRTWESIVRYHSHLKNNDRGFSVPGTFSRTGYAIVNIADSEVAESQGVKASIQGRALNEGGTLQGAHLPYVLMLVDEAATIADHSIVTTAMMNLKAGSKDFRVFMLANPEDWSDPSCQYCEPVGGIETVDVDTGHWMSTMGFKVRHHDGLKSPRLLSAKADKAYPFIMGQSDIDAALQIANGNVDAASYWKMVRGFPRPSVTNVETVLEYDTARARKCCDEMMFTGRDYLAGTAAGCDPAWTEGGDAAIWQGLDVMISLGVPMLCFRPPEMLPISATSGEPVIGQLATKVSSTLRTPGAPSPVNVAYDASGNQSLGGVVAMRTGVSGLEVNSSERASDRPFKEMGVMARERYYDRGTEAWVVLAEFIRAGQVRGLSREACAQLCTRRWATRSGKTTALINPLRLESKEAWSKREGRTQKSKSPNHADAAALAALAAKERLGIMPGSSALPSVLPTDLLAGFFNTPPPPDMSALNSGGYSSEWVGEGSYSPQ